MQCRCVAVVEVRYHLMYMCRYSSSDPVVQSETVTGEGPADDAAIFHQQHNQPPVSV